MRRTWILLLLLAACAGDTAPASDEAPAIDTPRALIAAMHDRYHDDWYKTLTFVQQTIQHRTDGTVDTTTWYEAYAAPGNLRIDFAPLADGNGILFASDSQYVFQDGAVTSRRAAVHPLLLLGFDVYHLPAEETVRKLEDLGFDLAKMHEAVWQDRPHYVVGAEEGDETSAQFWIDEEHLYFTRSLRPLGPGNDHIQETQFNDYQRLGGGWVAPEVLFYRGGQPVVEERYSDMQAGVALDAALFDPAHWRTTHWRAE